MLRTLKALMPMHYVQTNPPADLVQHGPKLEQICMVRRALVLG